VNRYKPIGWRKESYRHYLAAKGIKTRHKYFAEQLASVRKADWADHSADMIRSAFHDGRAEVPDFHEEHKKQFSNELVSKMARELSQGEAEGKYRSGAAETFAKDDLTDLTKDFYDNRLDYAQYKREAERRFAKHKQQYGTEVNLWKQDETNEGIFSFETMTGEKKPSSGPGYFSKKDHVERFEVKKIGDKFMVFDHEVGEFLIGYSFKDEVEAKRFLHNDESHRGYAAEKGNREPIQFTPDKARRLQKRYDEAVKKGEEKFTFEGHEMLTRYAKYVLQYIEMRGLK